MGAEGVSFDWRRTLATVAPVLASAFGGPMAGVAVSMAGKALGLDNATEQDIAEAVASGSPDVLVKLREVDTQFKLEMKRLDENKNYLEAAFVAEFNNFNDLNKARAALHGLGDSIQISFLDQNGII